MRPRFPITLALILLLALLSAGTALADPPTWPPANPFGVDMRDTIDESEGLSAASAAGLGWIRIQLFWRDVERIRTEPRTYNWSYYDKIFGNAAAAGMNLIVTLRENPDWAAATRCGPLYDNAALADFATAAVARYSQPPYNVKVWELYNEPDNWNTTDFLYLGGCWGDTPKQYADMLKVVYPAIKAQDPAAVVMLGGLGYEYRPSLGIVHLRMDFLDKVLKAGGGPYFDVLNFHYFDVYQDLWQYPNYPKGLIAKLRTLIDVLSVNGVGNKTYAVTELGMPHAGVSNASQKRTSQYVIKGNIDALAYGIHQTIWYQMVDNEPDPGLYGLLDNDQQPYESYDAYNTLAHELAGRAYLSKYLPAPSVDAFRFVGGGHTIVVAWYKYAGQSTMPFAARRARLVRRTCGETSCGPYQESIVEDGGAGDLDGKANNSLTLPIANDPVFLEDISAATSTPTRTATPSATGTPTATSTPTWTATSTPSATETVTVTPTRTSTATPSATPTASLPAATATATPSVTPTSVWTATPTATTDSGGTIAGLVWRDADADGTRQPAEAPLAGVHVNLSNPADPSAAWNADTDAFGQFQFAGLPAGRYLVAVHPLAGYFGTTANPVTIDLSAGVHVEVAFGQRALWRASLPLLRKR